jgi:hypothetical protein
MGRQFLKKNQNFSFFSDGGFSSSTSKRFPYWLNVLLEPFHHFPDFDLDHVAWTPNHSDLNRKLTFSIYVWLDLNSVVTSRT